MSTPPSPTETPFQSIHWDGIMPNTNGSISTIFNAAPKPEKIKHCEKIIGVVIQFSSSFARFTYIYNLQT
jgi:hypothetical protein